MTEEKPTVNVEEFNKLKADFEEVNKKLAEQTTAYGELSEKHTKLEKIFEERQTKTQEQILKALNLEKKPDKSDKEIITDRFNELSATVEKLQNDLSERDRKIALNDKKTKVMEIAKNYNFVDVNDVLGVIDYDNEDLEGQVKTLADTKKHWIAKDINPGKSFTQKDDKKEDDDFLKGFDGV